MSGAIVPRVVVAKDKAPRIVQLLDFSRPHGGSFIPMISEVLSIAGDRGWETEVILFADAHSAGWIDDLRAAGAKVSLAPMALKGQRRGLARWLRSALPAAGGPVVLHTHFNGFDIAAWIATIGRRDTNLIWHVHSALSTDMGYFARNVAKLSVIGRSVEEFLCPAQNIVDSTIARGAPQGRVHLLPTSIRPQDFPVVTHEMRRSARAELGLPEDATVLLHFGWHWELKGGDIFLELLRDLSVAHPQKNFIGAERGGEEERYVAYAKQLGIADRLRVVPPVGHVRLLHQAADMLVCPSREEGMAYATLEALCSGIPVVATAIPGHVYIGRDVEACRLTGHTPAEIAAGVLETLARTSEDAERERDDARDWIAANLSTEVIGNQLIDRYEALVGRTRP